MIPLAIPNLSDQDQKHLLNAFKSNWISTAGPQVVEFEQKFKSLIKTKYSIACNSGTSALHIAIKLAGVMPNEEVLVPSLTFAATANTIIYNQAIPVFFNCDEFLNINVKDVETFIRKNTIFKNGKTYNKFSGRKVSAVVPVHMYGNACDIFKISNLLKKRKIKIIEDAAESLGSIYLSGAYKGKHTGTIGNLGVFSFNSNKIITSGSGGMIVTNNKKLAEKALNITNQAKKKNNEYIHNDIGFNYRMNNICASIGLSQLKSLNFFLKKKREIFEFYKLNLKTVNGVDIVDEPKYSKNNLWMPILKIDLKKKFKKKNFISFLREKKIQVRGCWEPLHSQKPYKKYPKYKIGNLELKTKHLVCLPCSTNIKNVELKKVVKNIKDYFK